MKRLIAIAVASALVVASAGEALAKPAKKAKHPVRHYAQQLYYGQYGYRRSAGNNNGAAIALGMLAIGTIAALASKGHSAPVYGYGQAYPPVPYGAPVGYGYAAAPPPPVPVAREYEREKIVETRTREYEHVREVAVPPPNPYAGYGGGYYGY